MEKLASRLPGCMLRAAIRDGRSRTTRLQWDINAIWRSLFQTVEDVSMWNALVDQKDTLYSSALMASTCKLQRKFVALFAFDVPEDPYCAAYINPDPIIPSTTQHGTASKNAESVSADLSLLSSGPDGTTYATYSNGNHSWLDGLTPATSTRTGRTSSGMADLSECWFTPPQSPSSACSSVVGNYLAVPPILGYSSHFRAVSGLSSRRSFAPRTTSTSLHSTVPQYFTDTF